MSTARDELVLVTGASGFVGAAVTLELIKQGYKVRGTVRSQAKADAFLAKHPSAAPALTWAIVPDVSAPHALDAAAQGADHIVHVASPFHYAAADIEREMLAPALQGTRNALLAAVGERRVRRVVVTSSFAAGLDPTKGERAGYTYDERDWNPLGAKDAVDSGSPVLAYIVSKKIAEEAAWAFMRTTTPAPHFALTTICPPMVFGPPLQPVESMSRLNTSAADVWRLMDGSTRAVPGTAVPVWTDVRDVAKLHADALSNPKTANERYLAIAGHYSFAQLAHVLAEACPDLAREGKITPSDNAPPHTHYGTDSGKAERDFGIVWRGFAECVRDTAEALLEIQRELEK